MREFRIAIALVLALLIFAIPLIVVFQIFAINPTKEIGISDLQGVWGISVPADASNIEFASDSVESSFRLIFDVNPRDALDFAESICGALYSQYNPFEATDTIEFLHNTFLIKMNGFTYYSYSPNGDETVTGNRCNPTPGTPIQIHQVVVDMANSEIYRVRLEQPGRSSQIPSHRSLGINYVNPVTNFPIMIVGLAQSDNNSYLLAHPEICIDTLYTYSDVSAWRTEWSYLVGANVQITVDDERLPLAQISAQGRLVSQDMIGEANGTRNDLYWFYCVKRDWQEGLHSISISIETVLNENIDYTIQFQAS